MSDIIVSSESVRDWYMLKKRATPKPYPSIIRGENASKKRADAALTVFRHDLTNGSSGTKKTFTKLSRNRLNLNHQPAVPVSTIIPMHGQDLDVYLPVVPAATCAKTKALYNKRREWA